MVMTQEAPLSPGLDRGRVKVSIHSFSLTKWLQGKAFSWKSSALGKGSRHCLKLTRRLAAGRLEGIVAYVLAYKCRNEPFLGQEW